MADCENLPPVVWKSNFHATPDAFALLDGIVDIYVADFKFGNDACAKRMAGVSNYWNILTRNLLLAAGQGDLIVRHLLLPGHFDCCYRPILDWLRRNLPAVKLSLRDGYLPSWQAGRCEELMVPLDAETACRAKAMAEDLEMNVVT
jgi:putative pyruvate formate lyase activating enzyme